MGTARLARRRGGPHVHTEPADEPAQRTVEDVIFFHAFDFFAARARRERRGRCRHGRMIATPLSYGNTVDSVYQQENCCPTRQDAWILRDPAVLQGRGQRCQFPDIQKSPDGFCHMCCAIGVLINTGRVPNENRPHPVSEVRTAWHLPEGPESLVLSGL